LKNINLKIRKEKNKEWKKDITLLFKGPRGLGRRIDPLDCFQSGVKLIKKIWGDIKERT